MDRLEEIKENVQYTNKDGYLYRITQSDVQYLIRQAEMLKRLTEKLGESTLEKPDDLFDMGSSFNPIRHKFNL